MPHSQRVCFVPLVPVLAAVLYLACGSGSGPPTDTDDKGGGPGPVAVDTIAPASVPSLQCKSPGAGSLALQWIAPGDDGWTGTAARYDVRYSKSPIDERNWSSATHFAGVPAPEPAGTIQICRVNGLDSKASYFFGLKTADDADNESELSNLAYGTTLQEYMPPAAITDLNAEAVSPTAYLLTWTAPGDDGSTFGTASRYDVRYLYTQGVGGSNWQNARQVDGEPAPKPAGEPESLLVVLTDNPDGNYGFALKTADEVPNWSGISNSVRTLGKNSYLWAYPTVVRLGQDLTILFRSPGGVKVRVEMHRYWAGNACGQHQYLLYEGHPAAGVHKILYDFYDDEAQEYLRFNFYHLYVCVDGQEMATYRVEFTE